MKVEVGNSNAMSSLCTIIRDTNLTWAKILDRMQEDNFGLTGDVSPAKTHPNELFLNAMWNMFMKGDLSDMNLARPYRCTQWNVERNQACTTDFICCTVFEESAIIEDFNVFKI